MILSLICLLQVLEQVLHKRVKIWRILLILPLLGVLHSAIKVTSKFIRVLSFRLCDVWSRLLLLLWG